VALGLASVGAAKASVIGSIAYADVGSASVDSGDILTATSFTTGLFALTVGHNDLSTVPFQIIGPVTFSPGTPGSLSFSSPTFGTFTSTSILVSSVDPTPGQQAISFNIYGDYTSGSSVVTPVSNVLTLLTEIGSQTGGPGSSISDSGTLAFPAVPPSVPDGGLTIGLLGGALAGLGALRRKLVA